MSQFSFDVGLADFQRYVLDNSFQVPVLVDFWAEWCQPCQTLKPMLEKLADEYRGAFLLAKVNADREPELAGHLQVRSLPTVMLIRDGQIVETLVGAQPESAYRKLVDLYKARPSDAVLEQVEALWQQDRQAEAIALLREGVAQLPDELDLQVALASKLLEQGGFDEAGQLLRALPANVQLVEPVAGLLKRLEFQQAAPVGVDTAEFERRLEVRPDDHAARRELAQALVGNGDYEGAASQFLELMRRDRGYGDDAGRKGLLGVFEVLGGEHPVTLAYRRRMMSLLY